MTWVVLVVGLGLTGLVVVDLLLRRRGAAHRELVLAHDRARRAVAYAPVVRDVSGYRAATMGRVPPLPPAPRPAFLAGRVRVGVTAGALALVVAGVSLALRPHHPGLHLAPTLAGLTRVPDDRPSRLLQARAEEQLGPDSGLADPRVGRYGADVVVAGARVLHGDGVAAAEGQLARIVGVGGLTRRSDGLSCGRLDSPDGGSGIACLTTGRGVVVGVLDLRPGASADAVADLTRRVLAEGVS